MTIASMRTTVVLFSIFIVLNFAFFFLIVGNFTLTANVTKAGGWFGLICAALAWYGSAAGVLKATWGRDLLPNPPMPKLCEPRKNN
jgi:uncharacterized protein